MKCKVAALVAALLVESSHALDNGLIVPPMGWSSWYGFTQNINESMVYEMAEGMVGAVPYRAVRCRHLVSSRVSFVLDGTAAAARVADDYYHISRAKVSTGLHAAGYEHVWLDDGWALSRVNTTGCCLEYGPAPGCKDSCKVIEEVSESGRCENHDAFVSPACSADTVRAGAPCSALNRGTRPLPPILCFC